MGCYANKLEISGKATPNKTIASFPDVCLSPPSPPAGPLPLPYPVTSMASKTASGSGSVKIKKKEVGKKNGSKYSKCDGNQPATNSFGAGVMSHKLTGETKFQAYSMDVMIEKGGAERFLDLTTSNHLASTPNTQVMISAAGGAVPPPPTENECEAMRAEITGDRAGIAAETAAGTRGYQSRGLQQNTTSGTLAAGSTSNGGRLYGSSNQILADRATRVSGGARNYNTPTVPGYRAYAPTNSLACGGSPNVVHPTGRHSRHAEMNIMNKIDWSNPPSTITFAIDYPNSSGAYTTDYPCPVCQATIEEICECVDEIYVCNPETNEPEPQCN